MTLDYSKASQKEASEIKGTRGRRRIGRSKEKAEMSKGVCFGGATVERRSLLCRSFLWLGSPGGGKHIFTSPQANAHFLLFDPSPSACCPSHRELAAT